MPTRRRTPVRSLAGVILALAAIAALGFAAHAFLDVARGVPIHGVRGIEREYGPPAVGDRDFPATLELLTGAVLHPGHRVEVLAGGGESLARLWADLRAANRSILAQLYFCAPGAAADTLASILTAKASAGVSVLLLLDGFGCRDLTGAYLEELRRAGVEAAVFRPVRWHDLHRAQHRSHVRAIVVDGRTGFTGGFGLADQWTDGSDEGGSGEAARRTWRDANVRFTGPAVAQLQGAFAAAWTEATGQLLAPTPAPTPAVRSGGTLAGVLHTRPEIGSTTAERFLALSIAGARRTLFIANSYFVPDRDLRALLADAARRGVDVRILTAGAVTDVPSTRYAGRAHYAELLEAGVRIFEYQPTMMHAKTIVADGVWVAIGTMNFDNRSMRLNEELVLLARNPALGSTMDSLFHAGLEHAAEIDPVAFRYRPWTDRLRDWAASLAAPLL